MRNKVITIFGAHYELDLDTQEGRDLFAAYQLVSMFGMPAIPEDALSIEATTALAETRMTETHPYNASYKAALLLTAPYSSKEAHHISYLAYHNLPVAFRSKAIESLSKVLEYGNAPAFFIYQQGLNLKDEHRFDEAIAHIKAAIAMEPHDPLYHVWLANTLVMTNDLDAALSVLYEYRTTEHYKSGRVKTYIGNQTMQQMDYTIKDIEAKKARGYVYRPRKKTITNTNQKG